MPQTPTPVFPRLLALDFTTTAITEIDKTTGGSRNLVENLGGRPDGIVVDHVRQLIYWTNMGADFDADDGSVSVMGFDGTGMRQLVGNGQLRTGKQLILDAENAHLYWCDREGGRVMRSRTDGTELETLVARPRDAQDRVDILDQCVGIAIDSQTQQLYWSQKGPSKGGKGRLFRCGLAIPAGQTAANRQDIDLLADGLPEPIDLVIDVQQRLLFWTDRGAPPNGNSLNRARITPAGLEGHTIVCAGFGDAIGLSYEPQTGSMYVADHLGTIHRVNLASGQRSTVHVGGGYTGITQY